MMPVFEFQAVAKSFHGVPVLRGVSSSIMSSSVLGLVGGNGAGKSTLMNLAGGNLIPDGGSMRLESRPYAPRHSGEATAAGVAFVHQELNLFPNLTIAENLFLTDFPSAGPFIRRDRLQRDAAAVLRRVGLNHSPGTRLARLSPAERQLVEIAKALTTRPKLLILDEPTTSLSGPESARLFDLVRSLKADGCALVFISHALGDVLRLCDQIVVLRDGSVTDNGPTSRFDQGRLLSAMAGRSVQHLFPTRPDRPASAPPVLEVRQVSRPRIVSDISLTIHAGEIFGLSGLMGAGRTELARILFGLDPHASGSVHLDGRLLTGGPRSRVRAGMALLTESRGEDGICAGASVHDNIALATLPQYARGWWRLLSPARVQTAVDAMSEAVSLRSTGGSSGPIERLSGGNQQKAVLARWLLAQPRLLILDEPTRGIDALAKFEIYELILRLAAAGSGILLISSEQEELVALSDRIAVLSRGRLVRVLTRPDFDEGALLGAAFAHHQSIEEELS